MLSKVQFNSFVCDKVFDPLSRWRKLPLLEIKTPKRQSRSFQNMLREEQDMPKSSLALDGGAMVVTAPKADRW